MATIAGEPTDVRPTTILPWRQLGLISIYWFGINVIWGAYEGYGQKQVELIVGKDSVGSVIGVLELLGGLVAIAVVPTIGAISDYTTSRFGRRKGYIITGATFDVVFILGLALISLPEPPGWDGAAQGTTVLMLAYALLFFGLQFSSNFAQGPYQGYVPDLVAEPQVGIASGLVGVMRTVGLVAGFAVMAVGSASGYWGAAFLVAGLIELVLAGLTFVFVSNGPPGIPRGGRSWPKIAASAWDVGVLKERSFIRMTLVRFLFLMGTGIFLNLSLLYMERAFGINDPGERAKWWSAALAVGLVGTVLAALPAARVSDRTGRKPIVWVAALGAGIGIGILAVASAPEIALVGAFFLGAGSGAYLAVDWALMTEIIPLASSGRYMGLANIANSIAGPVGLLIAGPVMDAFQRAGEVSLGPRVAVGLGIVALIAASLILVGVHPRRDPRRLEAQAAEGATG